VIGELRSCPLQPPEIRQPRDGPQILAHGRIEAVAADMVAAAQRNPGQEQAGIDRMVEPG